MSAFYEKRLSASGNKIRHSIITNSFHNWVTLIRGTFQAFFLSFKETGQNLQGRWPLWKRGDRFYSPALEVAYVKLAKGKGRQPALYLCPAVAYIELVRLTAFFDWFQVFIVDGRVIWRRDTWAGIWDRKARLAEAPPGATHRRDRVNQVGGSR